MGEVGPLDESFWEAVRAARPRDEDLRVFRQWDEYLALVARVEAHERNQSGADKSSVERSDREVRAHFRNLIRVR
ncbi:MAG TPA: hypothetical protein VFL80_12685 [Thermoanaerobaculia bacterium]|nr:hypothetical protein [Thermoanaerobaculia bacterium]